MRLRHLKPQLPEVKQHISHFQLSINSVPMAKPKGRKHRMLLSQLGVGNLDLWSHQKPVCGPEIVEPSWELL